MFDLYQHAQPLYRIVCIVCYECDTIRICQPWHADTCPACGPSTLQAQQERGALQEQLAFLKAQLQFALKVYPQHAEWVVSMLREGGSARQRSSRRPRLDAQESDKEQAAAQGAVRALQADAAELRAALQVGGGRRVPAPPVSPSAGPFRPTTAACALLPWSQAALAKQREAESLVGDFTGVVGQQKAAIQGLQRDKELLAAKLRVRVAGGRPGRQRHVGGDRA